MLARAFEGISGRGVTSPRSPGLKGKGKRMRRKKQGGKDEGGAEAFIEAGVRELEDAAK